MTINLTERAANHIKRFLAGKSGLLRVGVRKTGCSGYSYVVEPADGIDDGDQVFESNGVKLVVNCDSLAYLEGVELDYVREGLNETFKFNNPNVKSTCGCGESFTV